MRPTRSGGLRISYVEVMVLKRREHAELIVLEFRDPGAADAEGDAGEQARVVAHFAGVEDLLDPGNVDGFLRLSWQLYRLPCETISAVPAARLVRLRC